jgi:hypothetical protein
MMAISEIICSPLETAKVTSRAPDLWTGIFQFLFVVTWERVGSFSITKREYFDPGVLFDFPSLNFAEFSPGGSSDTKREYFHPMVSVDFFSVPDDILSVELSSLGWWIYLFFGGREAGAGAGAVIRSNLSMKGQ